MEHLSNYHEDHPNQHKNGHMLRDETRHTFLSLLESQWKLRQQYDQNFPMEGKYCRTNTSIRKKKEIQKSRTVKATVRGQSRKANCLSKVVITNFITKFASLSVPPE